LNKTTLTQKFLTDFWGS